MRMQFLSRWLPAICCVFAILLLSLIPFLAAYNHPSVSDDFRNIIWDDYWGNAGKLYRHWSGRYLNNLLLPICPLRWHSLPGYRMAIIAIAVLFMLAFGMLVRRSLRYHTNAPAIICSATSLAALLLIVNNMDSLTEGFYWYAGAVTYTLPALMMAVLLYLLLRVNLRAGCSSFIGACIVLLIIAVVGGNESMLLLCNVVLVAFLLYYRKRSQRLYKFYRLLLIICLIGSVVAVFAPGNFERQGRLVRNVWMVWPTWLYVSQKTGLKWISDPFFQLFSVLFLFIHRPYKMERRLTNLVAAFLLPFAILLLLSFPGHYAMGMPPPARVYNIIYAFFVSGWIFFLLHLNASLQICAARSAINGGLRQIIAVIVILGLLANFNGHDFRQNNFFIVVKALIRGVPQKYNGEMNRRYAIISASKADTVAVPALHYIEGNPLFFTDIGPKPEALRNLQYGRYWGKGSVCTYADTAIR